MAAPTTPPRTPKLRDAADVKSPSSADAVSHSYTSLSSLLHPDSPSDKRTSAASSNNSQRRASGRGLGVLEETSRERDPTAGAAEDSGTGTGRKKATFAIGNEQPDRSTSRGRAIGSDDDRDTKDKDKKGKKSMKSMWSLIALTISMGGAQIAWVVELGYGTPYLLSLGLTEQLTSLVWLAGPLSGLIAQPLIGAISDSSSSRFRRRYWICVSTILLVFSGLALGFTEDVAEGMVKIWEAMGWGGEGWDPKRKDMVKDIAIGIAVTAFYCLDFGLNALQASLRNLVLDVTPGEQLAAANAWHGRFNHIGNILGFAMGSLNLGAVPILKLVGGGQFRKVCIVAIVLLVLSVWITCATQEEEEREAHFSVRKSKFTDVAQTIYQAGIHLPKPVRRVCYVQLCAFCAYFPFLFFSTQWVNQVMAIEIGHEPDVDVATRAGSLALLIYSFVAVGAGTVLPYLAARDQRLLAPERSEKDSDQDSDDEEDLELAKIREMVREWKLEAQREGKPLKLPHMPFMLRNIWTCSMLLFSAIMFSTFFITKVWQATVAISLVGICWAVACWVPFSIIMEYLKEIDDQQQQKSLPENERSRSRGPRGRSDLAGGNRPIHARAASTPLLWTAPTARPNERTGLIRSLSTPDMDELNEDVNYEGANPAGGTLMGLHNISIVMPQFIIAIIASWIFKASDPSKHNSVAHVLQFGGVMAFLAALVCRRVPPTKTEKAMRRRLAEMREESEEQAV